MRLLAALAVFVALVGIAAPLSVYAQERSLFGPIIPQEGPCACKAQPNPDPNGPPVDTAPSWGCVLDVGQNLINIGIALAVVFVVLAIAWAGFLLLTSGANATRRTQARTVVGNAVFGLVVILVAWLLIDFFMKAIYNPQATFSGEQALGPWNGILATTEDARCLDVSLPVAITSGLIDIVLTPGTGGSGTGGTPIGFTGALCPDNNQGCSVQALMSQGLNERQARAMSCIAMTESTGRASAVNPSSQACGLFQITNETSRGNWRQPENHRPPCSVNTPCTNAACNLQTAVIMFNRSGYQPWTCRNCNAKAQACVNRYDPGGR